MKNQKFDLHEKVTANIINLLESHEQCNFEKTWFSESGEIYATNPNSKITYSGLNQLLLASTLNEKGYSQNRWMGIKQGNKLGAKVKAGENGTLIVFYKPLYLDGKRNVTANILKAIEKGGSIPEHITKKFVLKYLKVWNLDQFQNMPEEFKFIGEKIEYSEFDKDELLEDILNKSGAKIEYKRFQDTVAGSRGANCYIPALDCIRLVERRQFKDLQGFARTASHELGHWTGHESRLNRDFSGKFGSKNYAYEELVAELFSAFICARLGFTSQITNNAAYIKSWLRCLKDDKKFVFKASSAAEKAVNYVMDIVEYGVVQKPAEAV